MIEFLWGALGFLGMWAAISITLLALLDGIEDFIVGKK
jgi:hypothetical protein